jgi:hypothetical protein
LSRCIKKHEKKIQPWEFSSTVPNYKLSFPVKIITQNLNKTATLRVAGLHQRVLVNARPGQRPGRRAAALRGGGGCVIILF